MKLIPALTIVATVVALIGCGSKPRKEEVAECTFPQTSDKAPQWVCPPHEVPGQKDVGFGSYAKSAAGYQFSLDQATAAARKDLAFQMQARVQAAVKAAIQSTGAPGTPAETVDQVASSVVSQITEAKLTGSKVARSATDSKGTVWVLVGMDIEASRRVVQEAVRTSMNNQSAQWQRVVGTRLQADMQADIMRMNDSR